MPPLAKVVSAAKCSSIVSTLTPKAKAGTRGNAAVIPALRATRTTSLTPIASIKLTATRFLDFSKAFFAFMRILQ